MDLCQAVHEGMLTEAGCPRDDETLRYSRPPPAGPTWEGAYADDHVILQKLTRAELRAGTRVRDTEIVENTVKSYLRNGPSMSKDKRVLQGNRHCVGHRSAWCPRFGRECVGTETPYLSFSI